MLGYGYQPYDATTAVNASAAAGNPSSGAAGTSPNGASASCGVNHGGAPVGSPPASASTENPEPDSASADPEAAYSPLVVSSVQDYVGLALRLTHQPKLRQFHSERILSRRHRLFQQDHHAVLAQWRLFAHLALDEASRRSDPAPPTPPEEFLPDLLEIPVDLPSRRGNPEPSGATEQDEL
jgi:hypothetical protein